ncbi:uncharacterized protein F5891DRAFT_1188372 [Suillus fuscotomentosus]|uniref:Uncharacterized protein n=1 Tax=Suillus fuscotomentosus TaxID=1912939 RepID=A0AAD4E7N7_9AGAM|nr:uncharacterized protein F5891DRAFT_1188372 [Suillus fuscotomentosus]KAG1900872.1 hypothetical protein F5891DRAFT_1188372 [Suillus fuscotomentosus]
MKHHTSTNSRCLLRAINTPYRQVLRQERDPVAVHRQSFPKPGELYVYLSSAVSRRGLDPFPIHRQSFEEILPSLTQCLQEQALSHHKRHGNSAPLSVRSTEQSVLQSRPASMSLESSQHPSPQFCGPNNTPIQSQTLASPGLHVCDLSLTTTSCSPSPRVITDNLTSGAQESPKSRLPVVPIEHQLIPDAGSSTPTDNSTLNHPQITASQYSARRIEHKICGLDQVMHWYDSRGCEPLLAPPPCESLECGDLYIHQSLSTPTTRQMWIWSAQQAWEDAQETQVHPLLPMHRLWFSTTGEPCWVTQKTISTYKGRLKVSGKFKLDQSGQSQKLFVPVLASKTLHAIDA